MARDIQNRTNPNEKLKTEPKKPKTKKNRKEKKNRNRKIDWFGSVFS